MTSAQAKVHAHEVAGARLDVIQRAVGVNRESPGPCRVGHIGGTTIGAVDANDRGRAGRVLHRHARPCAVIAVQVMRAGAPGRRRTVAASI